MIELRVRLFGAIAAGLHDGTPIRFPTHRCRALFGYLALHHGRPHPRTTLAGVFWPESPDPVARKRLRTNLWRIRAALGAEGSTSETALVSDGHSVRLDDRVLVSLDVRDFEQALDGTGHERLSDADLIRLEGALQLYRGHLLDGIYEDWCLYERERLKARYLEALQRVMSSRMERREWFAAIAVANRILQQDPLLEQVHRDLIRCHLRLGNRPAALRAYQQLTVVLREELGVSPMAETVALAERVRVELGLAQIPSPPSTSSARAIDHLREAKHQLSQAQRALSQGLDAVLDDRAGP